METTVITATAAALGSVVGATASIATTWISQRTQTVRANWEWRTRERQALYREFTTEASRLAVDALAHSLEQPDQIMSLYGILSRIRLMSGDEVLRQGEVCCRRILEMYARPNLTTDQIRAAVESNDLSLIDPLFDFSAACRSELWERPW